MLVAKPGSEWSLGRGRGHSTDLTDAQWAELEGFLDPPRDPSRGGRPQQYPRRRIADTVFYQLRTSVPWHLLPGDFPPWAAAWQQFCREASITHHGTMHAPPPAEKEIF